MNAAGKQLFGNLVTDISRLPSNASRELYLAMTGNTKAAGIDAISVVAVIGGI